MCDAVLVPIKVQPFSEFSELPSQIFYAEPRLQFRNIAKTQYAMRPPACRVMICDKKVQFRFLPLALSLCETLGSCGCSKPWQVYFHGSSSSCTRCHRTVTTFSPSAFFPRFSIAPVWEFSVILNPAIAMTSGSSPASSQLDIQPHFSTIVNSEWGWVVKRKKNLSFLLYQHIMCQVKWLFHMSWKPVGAGSVGSVTVQ